MEENKVCSFFGHRTIELTDELYATVYARIKLLTEAGCRIFFFGGYGEFDSLCREIVTKLMEESPELNIKRVYCVAQERYLRKSTRYFKREDYDEIIYLEPAFSGWYKSIYYRNAAMIDKSDFVIFYAEDRENSGAYKAYKYAKRKKDKVIINLYSINSY